MKVKPAGRFKFGAHTGLGAYFLEPLSWRDTNRDACARLLRISRNEGYTVTVLESGRRYEISEPEDALFISDNSGLVWLVDAVPCEACGADTVGLSHAFDLSEGGRVCGRECAQRHAEMLATEAEWLEAEWETAEGLADDSDDESSVLWEPSADAMAFHRALTGRKS